MRNTRSDLLGVLILVIASGITLKRFPVILKHSLHA
jgi:hypothetical protein